MKHAKVFYSIDNRDLFLQHLRIHGYGAVSEGRAYRLFALYELVKKDAEGFEWPADCFLIQDLPAYRKLKRRTVYRDLELLADICAIHTAKSVKRFNPLSFLGEPPAFVKDLLDQIGKGALAT